MNKLEDVRNVCITTGINGTTHVWNLKTGDLFYSLYKNKPSPNCITFLQDQCVLVAAQQDKPCLHIYNFKKVFHKENSFLTLQGRPIVCMLCS